MKSQAVGTLQSAEPVGQVSKGRFSKDSFAVMFHQVTRDDAVSSVLHNLSKISHAQNPKKSANKLKGNPETKDADLSPRLSRDHRISLATITHKDEISIGVCGIEPNINSLKQKSSESGYLSVSDPAIEVSTQYTKKITSEDSLENCDSVDQAIRVSNVSAAVQKSHFSANTLNTPVCIMSIELENHKYQQALKEAGVNLNPKSHKLVLAGQKKHDTENKEIQQFPANILLTNDASQLTKIFSTNDVVADEGRSNKILSLATVSSLSPTAASVACLIPNRVLSSIANPTKNMSEDGRPSSNLRENLAIETNTRLKIDDSEIAKSKDKNVEISVGAGEFNEFHFRKETSSSALTTELVTGGLSIMSVLGDLSSGFPVANDHSIEPKNTFLHANKGIGETVSPQSIQFQDVVNGKMFSSLQLNISSNSLEVGVVAGTHGWLRIRAELTEFGEINASLTSTSAIAVDRMRTELPDLSSYLQTEKIQINELNIHGPQIMMPDPNNVSSTTTYIESSNFARGDNESSRGRAQQEKHKANNVRNITKIDYKNNMQPNVDLGSVASVNGVASDIKKKSLSVNSKFDGAWLNVLV